MTICIEPGKTFHVTGHYPVLAGYDPSTGEALYVAVQGNYHNKLPIFTCVKDGASKAIFIHKNGKAETVNEFRVLVLRHDPVDSKPTGIPDSAMDPTGPVFWLDYWPKRDPSLPNDPEFESSEDEQHLHYALKVFNLTERSQGGEDRLADNCDARDSDNEENETSSWVRSETSERCVKVEEFKNARDRATSMPESTHIQIVESAQYAVIAAQSVSDSDSDADSPANQTEPNDSESYVPELTMEKLHRLEEEIARLREENRILRARTNEHSTSTLVLTVIEYR